MVRALMAASCANLPRRSPEPYRPDTALVDAARKEGQVLCQPTLHVDQIVRPLIVASRRSARASRSSSWHRQRPAVVRLMNEANSPRAGDLWRHRRCRPLHPRSCGGSFDVASARACLPPWSIRNALDRHQPRTRSLAQHQPGPAGARQRATGICRCRVERRVRLEPERHDRRLGLIATVLRHMGSKKASFTAQARQQRSRRCRSHPAVLDAWIAGDTLG